MSIMDKCRDSYEATVKRVIRFDHHEEFLRVGSPHWLDFKNGFVAGYDVGQKDMAAAVTGSA